MLPPLSIILAAFALVLLSFGVCMALLLVRVGEMRAKRIHPQKLSDSVRMAETLDRVQVADNFRNLFETPVLFYAWCALVIATGSATPLLATGAWVYVALRTAHSLVHCTYNKVIHRTIVFALGFAVLLALWIVFVLQLT